MSARFVSTTRGPAPVIGTRVRLDQLNLSTRRSGLNNPFLEGWGRVAWAWVYLAEQTHRAPLNVVLKALGADYGSALGAGPFEVERQASLVMDHP